MSSPDPRDPIYEQESSMDLSPAVVILGPTGVGKSEIAIQLAEQFGGEIVSADSRLFYRGMDIGTAKPSTDDRMRVPHHLIDVADPDEVWSLGLFQKEALKAIRGITERNHLPFIVGGTGQFIRAIIEGWSIPAQEPNEQLRKALAHWSDQISPLELHKKLAILDPPAADSIDPTNLRRTIRALEVIFSTGRLFSEQRKHGERFIHPLMVGLTCSRVELYQRIDDRIAKMMDAGFVREVSRLLDKGYSPDLSTLSAIGYGEIVAYLQGKISLDEAIVLMKRRTRMFVRRQANWFKPDDPQIHWFQRSLTTRHLMEEMISIWLKEIRWGKNP